MSKSYPSGTLPAMESSVVPVKCIRHNMDNHIADSVAGPVAFPITLRCLEVGDPLDECFGIHLQQVPDIIGLKESIKEKLEHDCKPHKLKLYLAGIPEDDQALNDVYYCIRNGGETHPLLTTSKQILHLLNNASKYHLHIIARLPGVLLSSISSPPLA